jgi:hypothetical protein
MKTSQWMLWMVMGAALSFSSGCELLVDFDRNRIDSGGAEGDACTTGCQADGGHDSGTDSGDVDAGHLGDGGMDAMVTDSGMDGGGTDAGHDAGNTMDASPDTGSDNDAGN